MKMKFKWKKKFSSSEIELRAKKSTFIFKPFLII